MTKYDATSRYQLDANNQSASRVSNTTTGVSYTIYRVAGGDTLESIAARHLGDPTRWWEVADINPQIKFPIDLNVGDIVRLPRS